MAVATHTLLRRLVGQLSAAPRRNRQHSLLLGQCLCSGSLLGLCLRLFQGRLLLGIAWALFAALVLALCTLLVGAVRGSAAVTGAVHTHANRLFDTLNVYREGGCGDPFVRFQGKAVLCEESTSTLLLECGTLQRRDNGRVGGIGDVSGSSSSMFMGCDVGRLGGRTIQRDGQYDVGQNGLGTRVREQNVHSGGSRVFLNDGRYGRGRSWGGGSRGRGGFALGRLFALEDAAHALDIFAQALAMVGLLGVLCVCGRRRGSGRHGDGWSTVWTGRTEGEWQR